MKVLVLTNEYPPHIYGGAGVHVEYLTKELSKLVECDVRCFGDQDGQETGLNVKGFPPMNSFTSGAPKPLQSPFDAVMRNMAFAGFGMEASIVHCHTWYVHFGGIVAKLAYQIPFVITVHSLEPLRPWKREQIGSGYDFSSWIEKTALEMADGIIAVSLETKQDILRHFNVDEKKIEVIPNGIDIEEYRPVLNNEILTRYKIDPEKPYVLFVGRITRQKGIMHLIGATQYLDPNIQVVLCAGSPDTDEISQEMEKGVNETQKKRSGVIWIQNKLDRKEMISIYTHANVFCCPSVYEPFGIINLEAMACEVPVVASAVGGIKEVVIHDQTGYLVPYEPENTTQFEKNIAQKINELVQNPEKAKEMGVKGRQRAKDYFSWQHVAERVAQLYDKVVKT